MIMNPARRQPIDDYESYKASIAAWHAEQAASRQGSPAEIPDAASTESPEDTPPANGAVSPDTPGITVQVVAEQPPPQRPHVEPGGEHQTPAVAVPLRDDLPAGPPGGRWKTSRPRKGRKQRPKDPQNLPTSIAAGTALFRPADRAYGSFVGVNKEAVARELSGTPGVLAVRVNARRNIVAVEASTADCLSLLLATTTLCGIAVQARPTANKSRSSGTLHDVDPPLTAEEILAGLESDVPVESVLRVDERSVQLRFAGPVPPDHVSLFKVRLPVRALRPRPLQCGNCGRFNHATASCRSKPRCPRCGGADHDRGTCGAAKARCSNCGGPHEVTDPRCPRWQRERRVVTEIARSAQPVSRAAVSESVRAHEQPELPAPAPRKSKVSRRTATTTATAPRQLSQALTYELDALSKALLGLARAISGTLPAGSPEQQTLSTALTEFPSP